MISGAESCQTRNQKGLPMEQTFTEHTSMNRKRVSPRVLSHCSLMLLSVFFLSKRKSVFSIIPMGLVIALNMNVAHGQKETHFDESKVPNFELPAALISQDGLQISTPEQWTNTRRQEVLTLFRNHVYGHAPDFPASFKVVERSIKSVTDSVLQLRVTILVAEKVNIRILVYLPNTDHPVPVFVGYNFHGNHTTTDDHDIPVYGGWVHNIKEIGITEHRSNSKARGRKSARWPFEKVVERGYALATICYADIDPDFDDGFKNGIHALEKTKRNVSSGGSIAAWAWGLSRVIDYFETDKRFDVKRVAVLGHSRLGKTALWAGAEDERFSIVISNNSGCGGAALCRREFGETIERINTNFPHWFCEKFKTYNDDVNSLPVDQHMLISLIAPRPVYVASASEDLWADPKGEFLSLVNANPVYQLFGKQGLPVNQLPEVNTPVSGSLGYHRRKGGHDLTAYDWEQYLAFAEKHWK